MKQYVIDELRPGEYERLQTYLEGACGRGEMADIYWLALDPSIYTRIQATHKDCQPFYAAIHLDLQSVALELLVRTKNRIRCDCIGYATKEQAIWLMETLEAIFERLEIKI